MPIFLGLFLINTRHDNLKIGDLMENIFWYRSLINLDVSSLDTSKMTQNWILTAANDHNKLWTTENVIVKTN